MPNTHETEIEATVINISNQNINLQKVILSAIGFAIAAFIFMVLIEGYMHEKHDSFNNIFTVILFGITALVSLANLIDITVRYRKTKIH